MKKVKFLAVAAFAIAIVSAFAFKTNESKARAAAYIVDPATGICNKLVNCPGGNTLCVVNGQQAFKDINTCVIPAFMQP